MIRGRFSRTFAFLAVFLLLGFLASFVVADQVELAKIKKANKDNDAGWEAEENAISSLPSEERIKMLGTLVYPGNNKKLATFQAQTSLPSSFDWRNVNRKNWVTSVKNQGSCGSCYAFGSIATLESWYLIKNNIPDPSGNVDAIDLSEQDIISCSLQNFGCSGGYLNLTYDFLRSDGVSLESCFPYQAQNLSCDLKCPDWQNQAIKIDSWGFVAQDVNSLKAAVYKQPITAAYSVFSDFYYYVKGVYKYLSGTYQGGHAICIVGWNDRQQCFVVKNSWGSNWGESGYFRIAYSEVDSIVGFGRDAAIFSAGLLPAPPRFGATFLWGSLKTAE